METTDAAKSHNNETLKDVEGENRAKYLWELTQKQIDTILEFEKQKL